MTDFSGFNQALVGLSFAGTLFVFLLVKIAERRAEAKMPIEIKVTTMTFGSGAAASWSMVLLNYMFPI